MDELNRNRSATGLKSIFLIIIAIIIATIALSTTATVVFDDRCQKEGEDWLHFYPGATVEEETFTFLNLFGIGVSRRVLYTPDDTPAVRVWYNDENVERAREYDNVIPSFTGNLNNTIRSARNREGTEIIQTYECHRELDLSSLGISNAG